MFCRYKSILELSHSIQLQENIKLTRNTSTVKRPCIIMAGNVPYIVHGDFTLDGVQWMQMKRETIARIAERHIGSEYWAKNRRNGNFPAGSHKCNKFIYDVLLDAGLTPPSSSDSTGTWPIRAADWVAYSSCEWLNMGTGCAWLRGDIIAERRNYTDASGHCGIAVSSSEVIGAGTHMVSRGDHGLQFGTVVRFLGDIW